MIVALLSAMNWRIPPSGRSARDGATRKNPTAPATVSEPTRTKVATAIAWLGAVEPGPSDGRRGRQDQRQVLGVRGGEGHAEPGGPER